MPQLFAIPGGPAAPSAAARSVDLLLREHLEPAVGELKSAAARESVDEMRALAYELVVLAGLVIGECRRAGTG